MTGITPYCKSCFSEYGRRKFAISQILPAHLPAQDVSRRYSLAQSMSRPQTEIEPRFCDPLPPRRAWYDFPSRLRQPRCYFAGQMACQNVNPARRVRNLLGIYLPDPILACARHDCTYITLKSLVEKKTAPPERGKLLAVPGKEAPIGVRQRKGGSRDSQKKRRPFSGHPCSPCRQGV
jgi:hypothetical protein